MRASAPNVWAISLQLAARHFHAFFHENDGQFSFTQSLPDTAHIFYCISMIFFFSLLILTFQIMALQMKMTGNDGQRLCALHFHDFFHENDGQHQQRHVTTGETARFLATKGRCLMFRHGDLQRHCDKI